MIEVLIKVVVPFGQREFSKGMRLTAIKERLTIFLRAYDVFDQPALLLFEIPLIADYECGCRATVPWIRFAADNRFLGH